MLQSSAVSPNSGLSRPSPFACFTWELKDTTWDVTHRFLSCGALLFPCENKLIRLHAPPWCSPWATEG